MEDYIPLKPLTTAIPIHEHMEHGTSTRIYSLIPDISYPPVEVLLSAIRDALSTIGFSLPEVGNLDGVVTISIFGFTRPVEGKPNSLIVTSGTVSTVESLISEE